MAHKILETDQSLNSSSPLGIRGLDFGLGLGLVLVNDDDHLLVHVPAAQEAGPAAEGETSDELGNIAGAAPQLDQGGQPES